MECPYCFEELEWHDYFGKYTGQGMSGMDKRGNIYKCPNEECDSQSFNYFFWNTLTNEELREGYPC